MSAARIATELQRDPLSPEALTKRPEEGGVPHTQGLYSWWMKSGSLPGVTGPRHPRADFELLYIGIAPARAGSKATLRSRICGQHLGGNIGSSTFRLSLAALLAEQEGWHAASSGSRTKLTSEDNAALSAWQREHLRLRWFEQPEPWLVEHRVIALLKPPLNLADNPQHPFGATLRAARARLKAGARD